MISGKGNTSKVFIQLYIIHGRRTIAANIAKINLIIIDKMSLSTRVLDIIGHSGTVKKLFKGNTSKVFIQLYIIHGRRTIAANITQIDLIIINKMSPSTRLLGIIGHSGTGKKMF